MLDKISAPMLGRRLVGIVEKSEQEPLTQECEGPLQGGAIRTLRAGQVLKYWPWIKGTARIILPAQLSVAGHGKPPGVKRP